MDFRYFKKFGGNKISDIIKYLSELLTSDMYLNISVGCDSAAKNIYDHYVLTIVISNQYVHNGSHVIYMHHRIKKHDDIFTRLYKEAELCIELAQYIHDGLSDKFSRNDLDDYQLKKYKFHLEQQSGKHSELNIIEREERIRNTVLTMDDYQKKSTYKICDIHLDFNLYNDNGKNKSYPVFKAAAPWAKSSDFRTFVKPYSPASTYAADLLLK